MSYFFLILNTITRLVQLSFDLHKNPKKAKTYSHLITYKYSPFTIAAFMLITTVLLVGISPISFYTKAKIGGIGYGYFAFSMAISMAIICFLFARHYYNEFKNYKPL
ncbi:hypothetical protein [Cellulophaga sp. L1A9]|uniref:hypothetical protein n=1 Tax=Cellulophaga sp. L1A9 TaxID=2686362 RepID=UPI00131A78D2|nr:hypothetical protein [Cellulophaga sp. L1A9]